VEFVEGFEPVYGNATAVAGPFRIDAPFTDKGCAANVTNLESAPEPKGVEAGHFGGKVKPKLNFDGLDVGWAVGDASACITLRKHGNRSTQ